MLEHFLQSTVDPPPVAGSGDGGLTIDLGALADAIWSSLLDHLNQLGSSIWSNLQPQLPTIGMAIWNDLGQWLYSLMRALFLTLWNAALFSIPDSTTTEFGPVLAMMPAPGAIAAAGITLALALLGLRTILQGMSGYSLPLDYLLGRFMVWTAFLSMLPWIIQQAIAWEQDLARSVAIAAIVGILPQDVIPNPLALFLLLILGLRLLLKLASNVVHIAVAIVWAPVAGVCGLIPSTQHIAVAWVHEFFGRLAGAILALIATGVGLGLAVTNGGGGAGDFAIFGAAGAFIAAADLVDWLAKTPGTSLGGALGGLIRTGAAAASLLPTGYPISYPPLASGPSGAAGSGNSALAVPAPSSIAPYYSFD